jgi:phosphoribosylformylglycinamidine cyclo-ligase
LKKTITYKSAGVNIDAGMKAVKLMKGYARSTFNNDTLSDLGTFGGLFRFQNRHYKEPVLVASSDGVGTKVLLALKAGVYHTVGQDLVNHCVNDILVQGARPLFFLDYFATGVLDPKVASEVVRGLSIACVKQKTVLLGGETAEMPGLYAKGHFDLAGTIVGAVEKSKLITGQNIKSGDAVIGLASSGLHTNGYSLARKIIGNISLKTRLYGKVSLGQALLVPHRCYADLLLPLLDKFKVKGLAHITGGGFYDNIPRILPRGVKAVIKKGSWEILPVFEYLVKKGNVYEKDAYRTFNMGVGMVVVLPSDKATAFIKVLAKQGESASWIGSIEPGKNSVILK